MSESFYTEGAGGLRLHGRRWRTSQKSKATLIGVHGYSEHSGRYDHVAKYFNERGYDVFWIDLPGHGHSDGKRNSIENFDDYVVAIERLLREAERSEAKNPFHLFGHSLGGLASLRFIQESKLASQISSLTLSSPLLGLGRYPPKMLPLLKFVTSVLPDIILHNEKDLGNSVLTSDPGMKTIRDADKLVNKLVSTHWLREVLKAREKVFSDVEKIRLPFGIFRAGKEFVVDGAESDRLFSLVSFPKKTLKVYPEMLHEIVNEVERVRVIEDIFNWIN
jgi:lysophospholipase